MALNDLHFAAERRLPRLAVICLALAVVSAVAGMGARDSLLLAILPASLAVASWVSRPREFEGSVTDDGIELTRPPMFIPSSAIRRLDFVASPSEAESSSFEIRVHHERGVLVIPPSPGINSAGIFEALDAQLAPGGSRQVNPILLPYLQRYERTFGPERIWSYRASPFLGDIHRPSRWKWIGLATLATGLLWIFLDAGSAAPNPWAGAGAFLLLIAGLFFLFRWGLGRPARLRQMKGWRESSLVITPVGLAMVQGDLKGELTWDQIRGVIFRPRPRRFQILSDSTLGLDGILLNVEETVILIANIYDRPIDAIHERILSYWNPERAQAPIGL